MGMNLEKVKLILIVVKYAVECGLFFFAGYFWGKNNGFEQGFKLGALLAKLQLDWYDESDNDDEK